MDRGCQGGGGGELHRAPAAGAGARARAANAHADAHPSSLVELAPHGDDPTKTTLPSAAALVVEGITARQRSASFDFPALPMDSAKTDTRGATASSRYGDEPSRPLHSGAAAFSSGRIPED
jgi:hypothetical protein